jgi:alcohol dehydrogenase YqhD (iron-dependent ADH family)
MISIAGMFRGNLEKFHDAFTNIAMMHYRKLSNAAKLKQYRVEIWSAEEQAGIAAGVTCLKSTFETIKAKGAAVSYPFQSTQELMIQNSLQLTEPGHIITGKLDIWSQDLSTWNGDHEAFYHQLPDCFK